MDGTHGKRDRSLGATSTGGGERERERDLHSSMQQYRGERLDRDSRQQGPSSGSGGLGDGTGTGVDGDLPISTSHSLAAQVHLQARLLQQQQQSLAQQQYGGDGPSGLPWADGLLSGSTGNPLASSGYGLHVPSLGAHTRPVSQGHLGSAGGGTGMLSATIGLSSLGISGPERGGFTHGSSGTGMGSTGTGMASSSRWAGAAPGAGLGGRSRHGGAGGPGVGGTSTSPRATVGGAGGPGGGGPSNPSVGASVGGGGGGGPGAPSLGSMAAPLTLTPLHGDAAGTAPGGPGSTGPSAGVSVGLHGSSGVGSSYDRSMRGLGMAVPGTSHGSMRGTALGGHHALGDIRGGPSSLHRGGRGVAGGQGGVGGGGGLGSLASSSGRHWAR